MNGAVSIHDHIASVQEHVIKVRGIGLRLTSRKVCIDVAFNAFGSIRFVDEASLASVEQISAESHDRLYVTKHRLVGEMSSLMNVHCNVRLRTVLEIG